MASGSTPGSYDGLVTIVKLNGHPTWASLAKSKRPNLLLLHGGMSSSASMMASIGPWLATDFRIVAFDRRGHGRTGDTDEPFHYDAMADEAIAFLELLGQPSFVVGHSDGGIVALLVAQRRADLVRRVVAVGANYHYSGLRPTAGYDFDGPDFDAWCRKYAELSPDGAQHARVVVEKSLVLFSSEPVMGVSDLASITVPVLVMAGDDEPIELSHTCALYEAIPHGQLAIVPGTSHAVLKERPKESAQIIRHFFRAKLPPKTYQPNRRKPLVS